MSDEERLDLAREAAGGDLMAQARLDRMHSRDPNSLRAWLDALVGQVIFIEGIRINYRGPLVRIIWSGDGKPEGLIFSSLERISYMDKSAPNTNTTFRHKGERFVPWDCVHDIGKVSLESWS